MDADALDRFPNIDGLVKYAKFFRFDERVFLFSKTTNFSSHKLFTIEKMGLAYMFCVPTKGKDKIRIPKEKRRRVRGLPCEWVRVCYARPCEDEIGRMPLSGSILNICIA